MPLKLFRCPECGEEFRTKTANPVHCDDVAAEHLMTPPGTKFMEKLDADHNKSNMVGQQAMLKERARKYSRDHETHDLIQMNDKESALKNQWLKEDGTTRKAIDDK